MYNDTIKVANKIISDKDLMDIFLKMFDEMEKYKKLYQQEKVQNEMYEREYQHWTVKDFEGSFRAIVNFYDDTNVTFDNIQNFMSIFSSRLAEIRNIYINYGYFYYIQNPTINCKNYNQRITMNIYERKMDIDINLSSEDRKMDSVYELIKNKILNAPEKYDMIIKKKRKINNIVGLAIGFIPSIILCTLLLVIPMVRNIYSSGYVVYPIGVLLVAYFLGTICSSVVLDKFYKNITPDQKYVGYDTTNYKSIYKDDIDSYVQTGEILIGKNVGNLECRNQIIDIYNKYKKFLFPEFMITLVISIVVLFF